MEQQKKNEEIIESFIYDYPIVEFYHLSNDDLVFSDKIRTICETDCKHYGKTWACPPAIESVSACMQKCHAYEYVFLFSSIAEVADNMDFAGCLNERKAHEKMSEEIGARFKEHFGDVLMLTTGCTICDECTYPNAPCRFPDRSVSTIESHGILIMQTALELGMSYDCGNNIVTYFALIFYNA